MSARARMAPEMTCGTEALLEHPELWAAPDVPLMPCGQSRRELAQYIDLLLKWNRALNLSGRHEPLSLLRDLVQDSFFLAAFLDKIFPLARKSLHIWDLGAGAGLPGAPLRIVWRRGHYTWVEARQKRASFLKFLDASLGLGMDGYAGRAEDFFRLKITEPAQCIISRAFLPWPQLLEFCASGLAPDGIVVVMANEAPPVLPAAWRLADSRRYELPGRSRWLWAVGKSGAPAA